MKEITGRKLTSVTPVQGEQHWSRLLLIGWPETEGVCPLKKNASNY